MLIFNSHMVFGQQKLSLSIMRATFNNYQFTIGYCIHNPVFIINPS